MKCEEHLMAEYLKSFKWELLLQMFTYLKIERVKQVRDGQGIELLNGGSPFLLSLFFYNSVFSILLNLDLMSWRTEQWSETQLYKYEV